MSTVSRTLLLVSIAGTMTALHAGCAVFQAHPGEQEPLIILSHQPTSEPLPAATMFKPLAETARFSVVQGDDMGTTVSIVRAPTSQHNATWVETEKDARAEFFRLNEDGDVLLTAAIDYDEDAVSHFDPPLIAYHATISPGEPIVQTVAIRVVDLHDASKQRAAGTVTQTIEHLGRRRVRVLGGSYVADCLSIRFDAKLGLARAKQTTVLYVVEGIGVLAAEHDERITALGLFTRTAKRTLIRRQDAPVETAAQTGR